MGVVWHKSLEQEKDAAARIYAVSRRAVLFAVVLSGLVLIASLIAEGSSGLPQWSRVGLWGIFAWSCIVLVYAAFAYWRARGYARRKARDAGMVDMLTGLPNLSGLIAALERYEGAAGGPVERHWLVIADLLDLDRVNYEFGYAVGDRVVHDIAELLRAGVPDKMPVGRVCGGQFLAVMPWGDPSDAQAIAEKLTAAIDDYGLDLGRRGRVSSVKARVRHVPYSPDLASLHETVADAMVSGESGRREGAEAAGRYHVSRVTLGAFAVHQWEELSDVERTQFQRWQRELDDRGTERMAEEIARLLGEKAEMGWADCVTAVPLAGSEANGRRCGARDLAQAVARRLGVPYRDLMRADTSGPESRRVEPVVDAAIERRMGVLLVADIISSGILERRCVRNLSTAGARVDVVAWVAH
ncbi:MAG: diguanylate cyclase [Planctomycetota bacterium]|jgi:diguanylate cyclase (GGDEF)-like protein